MDDRGRGSRVGEVMGIGLSACSRVAVTRKTVSCNPASFLHAHLSFLIYIPVTAQMFVYAARDHCRQHGTRVEHFAKIASKNRRHGTQNPRAAFQVETHPPTQRYHIASSPAFIMWPKLGRNLGRRAVTHSSDTVCCHPCNMADHGYFSTPQPVSYRV